jgi:hypothetical protein
LVRTVDVTRKQSTLTATMPGMSVAWSGSKYMAEDERFNVGRRDRPIW